jgi:hypothetical protein
MDPSPKGERSDERAPDEDGLSDAELAAHSGEAIPDRAALSKISSDVAIPLDPAAAADVLAGLIEGDDEELEARPEAPPGDERAPDG